MLSRSFVPVRIVGIVGLVSLVCAAAVLRAQNGVPRTPDGHPNLQGIWKVGSRAAENLEAGFVQGGPIPYLPAAAQQRTKNLQARATADPLGKCYIPGVPRIMYMDWPFQILQTTDHVAMVFEWSLDYRLIYTNGSPHETRVDPWMGDSRGRWEGDTLVVDVTHHNEQTWLDKAGNFHSDALHVVERYTMLDANTIRYEATIEDPKVFTRPWTISVSLSRQKGADRVREYQLPGGKRGSQRRLRTRRENLVSGSEGADPGIRVPAACRATSTLDGACVRAADSGRQTRSERLVRTGWRRRELRARGARAQPRERSRRPAAESSSIPLTASRHISRGRVPSGRSAIRRCAATTIRPRTVFRPAFRERSYVPTPFQLVQTSDTVATLHERMQWRLSRSTGRGTFPTRFVSGRAIPSATGTATRSSSTRRTSTAGRGAAKWATCSAMPNMSSSGLFRSMPNIVRYEATITDPLVYTRPFTIAFPLKRIPGELFEAACHEEDHDLPVLKRIRDQERARRR